MSEHETIESLTRRIENLENSDRHVDFVIKSLTDRMDALQFSINTTLSNVDTGFIVLGALIAIAGLVLTIILWKLDRIHEKTRRKTLQELVNREVDDPASAPSPVDLDSI